MKTFVKKNTNYIAYLVILILLVSLKINNPSFVKLISYLSFDLYQKIFTLNKNDSDVIIIDIDEKSLGKFGQFPWSRSVFASILEKVNKDQPKAVGFDIFFTEKDKQSPDEIIKSGTPITIRAFTGNTGDTGELPTQVFAHVSGTSKTDTGVMLEVEDYGTIDPSQVVRFKN